MRACRCVEAATLSSVARWERNDSIFFYPEKMGMGITAEVLDTTKNPLTIGLLCAIGLAIISQDLANLIY